MSGNKIRDKRTISPFKLLVLDPSDAADLMRIRGQGKPKGAYKAMLDIMEAMVAEDDTALINCDASDDAKVLAQHKITKASWNFFIRFQQRVDVEVSKALHLANDDHSPQPPRRDADY